MQTAVVCPIILKLADNDSHWLPQKRVGDKAFGMIAPRIWNQLPFEVRCAGSKEAFKRALKYYFFNRFYV